MVPVSSASVTTTTAVPASVTTTTAVPTTIRSPVAKTTNKAGAPPTVVRHPVAPPASQAVPVSPLTVQRVAVQPVTPQPASKTPEEVAATVLPGVVDVDAYLASGTGYAAGTGMVVSASGLVVTNNHVVEGSTSFVVTEVESAQTFQADLVGVNAKDDVAVLQMVGASGLATVTFGDSSAVTPGQAVVAIGNAEGAGGAPSVTGGTVEAVGQTITADDAITGTKESLVGMIETDAETVPGDSGGPLVNEAGAVIGMVTAGAEGNGPTAPINVSFVIPISTATTVASAIENEPASAQGLPGSLGVVATSSPEGAVATAISSESPLPAVGFVVGDTITSVGGSALGPGISLGGVLQEFRAGQQVAVTWVDQAGALHSATVTLLAGAAT